MADWGALPESRKEVAARTRAALANAPARPGRGAVVPAEEIDEVRIVASWTARNEPPVLELDDADAAATWAWEVARGLTHASAA